MSDLGEVLAQLRSFGLLERSVQIVAGDVHVQLLPAKTDDPREREIAELLRAADEHETLFASS